MPKPFRLDALPVSQDAVDAANALGQFKGARRCEPSLLAIKRASTAKSASPARIRSFAYHPDERVVVAFFDNHDLMGEIKGNVMLEVMLAVYDRAIEAMDREGLIWHPFLTSILGAPGHYAVLRGALPFLKQFPAEREYSPPFGRPPVTRLSVQVGQPPLELESPRPLADLMSPLWQWIRTGPPRSEVLPLMDAAPWQLFGLVCQYYPSLAERDVTLSLRRPYFGQVAYWLAMNTSLSSGGRYRILRGIVAGLCMEAKLKTAPTLKKPKGLVSSSFEATPSNVARLMSGSMSVPASIFRRLSRALVASEALSMEGMALYATISRVIEVLGAAMPGDVLWQILSTAPVAMHPSIWKRLVMHPSMTEELFVMLLEQRTDFATRRIAVARARDFQSDRVRRLLSVSQSSEVAASLLPTEHVPAVHERLFRRAVSDARGVTRVIGRLVDHGRYERLDLVDPVEVEKLLVDPPHHQHPFGPGSEDKIRLLAACIEIASSHDPATCPLSASAWEIVLRHGPLVLSSYIKETEASAKNGNILFMNSMLGVASPPAGHFGFVRLWKDYPAAVMLYSEDELLALAASPDADTRTTAREALTRRASWRPLPAASPSGADLVGEKSC